MTSRDRASGISRAPSAAGPASAAASEAWSWYSKGAGGGEPHSLARFAEQQEQLALHEPTSSNRNEHLLRAFKFYASAAERARVEDWPDEAWRVWRYRRASLARLLGREGLMQQVAASYAAVRAPGE